MDINKKVLNEVSKGAKMGMFLIKFLIVDFKEF